MSHTDPEEFKKHIKTYITVFVSLMILTVITVAASYLHVAVGAAIIIALIIASFKASLVAGFFMHLIGEQKFIHQLLVSTVFFLVVMFILIISAFTDKGNVKLIHYESADTVDSGHH